MLISNLTGVVLVLAATRLYAQDTTYIQWDPPQQISFAPYFAAVPQIVAEGDTVHLVWTTSNGPSVFYARSTNAGVSWSEPLVLDDTTNSVGRLSQGTFSAALQYGYVFWSRCTPPCVPLNSNRVLDLRRSADAGESWLPRVTIADDGINTGNSNYFSAARGNVVGLINTRTPQFLVDRFAWSSVTGLEWNFYNVNTDFTDRFVILSNGIHLVRARGPAGAPRREVAYLYSSDYGETWTLPYFLSSQDSILSDEPHIAGDDQGNLWTVWRDGKYGGVVDATILSRRSTDFGLTWENEIRLTPIPVGVEPKVASDGPFVVALWSSQDIERGVHVRLSTDYGNTFLPREIVAPGIGGALAFVNQRIHIAYWYRPQVGDTSQICHRRGRIITTGIPEGRHLPFAFALFQNYPNPFNPTTEIRYQTSEVGHVSLKVYNILGQEVAKLVDEVKQPGRHRTTWDASGLPSGVYFYKMQTPKFYAVKKCLLLK